MLYFGDDTEVEVNRYFEPSFFPEDVMHRERIFNEDVWGPLLRPGVNNEPEPAQFMPKAEFKLIVVCEGETLPPATAAMMRLVEVRSTESTDDNEDEWSEISKAFGLKAVKRNR